jgi:hypothetical protein
VKRGATLSPCGTYRYELTRRWADGDDIVTWIMLNPSTADADIDDPTVRRCIDFSIRWGCAGLVVRNLFALRATDPRQLAKHPAPVGPDNDKYLAKPTTGATIAAWGTSGGHLAHARAAAVLELLRAGSTWPLCVALTDGGAPRHPLYVAGATLPRPLPGGDGAPVQLPGQAALFEPEATA